MGCGTSTESSLDVCGAVIHTSALQCIKTFDVQQSVGHTYSDNHGLAEHIVALEGSHSVEPVAAALQVGHAARDMEVCSELQSLKIDEMGEIATIDAIRKTGVILNPGCRTRLSPGPQTIQHERRQAFRGRIDSRSEARRAGTQNQNVIN